MPYIKIFKYLPDIDAFDVTNEYRAIAEDLGISEWNPVVWIGRLFMMDNDFGEHWFDNWEIRKDKEELAVLFGLDSNNLLFIDPERFQDGSDGPCHTNEFRKNFWTDVLKSLELSLETLFDEARKFNAWEKKMLDDNPEDRDYKEGYIPDLDERIKRWKDKYSGIF